MRCYYDLHIHSVLSPCADVLMTPNNIFNMAMLKGIDIIAITDHNSLKQLPVCRDISYSYDMLFIPGVEVTVSEGIDMLIYFKSFTEAMKFDELIEKFLPNKVVDLDKYKEQTICDINDELDSIYPNLLTQSLNLSLNQLKEILKDYNHLLFFAHIDRYIDKVMPFMHKHEDIFIEYKHKPIVCHRKCLVSSDAHQITDILERNKNNTLNLENLSLDSFLQVF